MRNDQETKNLKTTSRLRRSGKSGGDLGGHHAPGERVDIGTDEPNQVQKRLAEQQIAQSKLEVNPLKPKRANSEWQANEQYIETASVREARLHREKEAALAPVLSELKQLATQYARTKRALKYTTDAFAGQTLKTELSQLSEKARTLCQEHGLDFQERLPDFTSTKIELKEATRREGKLALERLQAEMIGSLLKTGAGTPEGTRMIHDYVRKAETIHRDAGFGKEEQHLLQPFWDAKAELQKNINPIDVALESSLPENNQGGSRVQSEYQTGIPREKITEKKIQKPGLNFFGFPNKARREEIRAEKEAKRALITAKNTIVYLADQYRNTVAAINNTGDSRMSEALREYKKQIESMYTLNEEALRRNPEIIGALESVGIPLSSDQTYISDSIRKKSRGGFDGRNASITNKNRRGFDGADMNGGGGEGDPGENEEKSKGGGGRFRKFLKTLLLASGLILPPKDLDRGTTVEKMNTDAIETTKLMREVAAQAEKADEDIFLKTQRQLNEQLMKEGVQKHISKKTIKKAPLGSFEEIMKEPEVVLLSKNEVSTPTVERIQTHADKITPEPIQQKEITPAPKPADSLYVPEFNLKTEQHSVDTLTTPLAPFRDESQKVAPESQSYPSKEKTDAAPWLQKKQAPGHIRVSNTNADGTPLDIATELQKAKESGVKLPGHVIRKSEAKRINGHKMIRMADLLNIEADVPSPDDAQDLANFNQFKILMHNVIWNEPKTYTAALDFLTNFYQIKEIPGANLLQINIIADPELVNKMRDPESRMPQKGLTTHTGFITEGKTRHQATFVDVTEGMLGWTQSNLENFKTLLVTLRHEAIHSWQLSNLGEKSANQREAEAYFFSINPNEFNAWRQHYYPGYTEIYTPAPEANEPRRLFWSMQFEHYYMNLLAEESYNDLSAETKKYLAAMDAAIMDGLRREFPFREYFAKLPAEDKEKFKNVYEKVTTPVSERSVASVQ